MSELRNKTKFGLYWSAAGHLINRGMQFVFGIVLANLLSPDAYGVVGMLSIFVCIVKLFVDCGFSQSLIRKQDRKQIDFSTEFFFNIVVGFIGYLVLFIASPFIASFYNMPILSPVLKVVGLGVIINSLCVVQSSQFAIRLDFKTPAKLSMITQLTTGCVGILLAYYGWGVWALVLQQLAGSVLYAILVWYLAGWKPTFEFSKESFKYQWNFGSKVLASNMIQQVYDNLYPLVIGKFFSARSLGLYSRAQAFAFFPSTNISSIINSVVFPILSKINQEVDRVISIYRKMIKATAFLVFPMMLGLAAVASPLIKILLNEEWFPCITYLRLLCLALIWQPLSSIHLNTIKVIGRTDVVLKLEIMKRGAGLLSIFGAIPYGVTGMCIGFDIFYIYCFTLNTYFVSRTLGVKFLTQVKDILPILLNAVIMAVLVYLTTLVFDNIFLQLLGGIIIGIVYYSLSSYLCMKSLMFETLSLLRNK